MSFSGGPARSTTGSSSLRSILGRGGRDIAEADAMAHVAGYTICNDVSTRDVMFRPGFPMTDFADDQAAAHVLPHRAVHRADASSSATIASCASRSRSTARSCRTRASTTSSTASRQLVSYASRVVELLPGDLLLTGSPAGNAAHHGNRWLRPGDVMEGEITGLGVQRNRCVAP